MRKVLKKSYRLGISAGVLTGMFFGLLSFLICLVLPLYRGLFPDTNYLTLFLSILFSTVLSYIILSILFISLLNILPSNSIFWRIYFLILIITLMLSPIDFILHTTIYGIEISSSLALLVGNMILSPFIIGFVYFLFYMFLAKWFKGIVKVNKTIFVITILLLLFLLFISSMVSGVAYQIQTNRAFLREMVQNSEKQRTLFHEDSPAVSNIDESEIESEIFELINQKRAEFGNPAVEWHSKVYEISKVYSREMAEKGDFAHTTASGMSVADRFRTANLFYIIANEILYLIPSSTENIAEQAVEGWMDSPGHRSVIVDRDKFFTHAAVGVTCLDKYCYIVMNFAKFNIERELTFLPDQYLAVNLNDASLGLYDEYPLLIEITSDTPVCVYILEGEEEIDPFLEEFYDRYYDTKGKTDFTRKTAAKKDSYLLIINNGKKSATVSYRLQYN